MEKMKNAYLFENVWYTERQKKLITSSEWRSLKSTSSKWIIFGHRYKAIVLLMRHIWKIKGLLLSKRRKMRWNCKRSFFKNHRKCSLRTSTIGCLFRTFNFKGGLCNHRAGYCPCRAPCPGGEQFCDFFFNDLLQFHLILLSFDFIKRLIFEMCLVRSTIANLCPIRRLRARRALTLFKDVPLRTIRAQLLYKVQRQGPSNQKGAITVQSLVMAPFWFWTEHLWTMLMPFLLSADKLWFILMLWILMSVALKKW